MQKLIKNKGWGSTIRNIPRYVTKAVHEFYANLSDNIVVPSESQFEKVYVRGNVYEFSRRAICDYLNILVPENSNFEKDYAIDDIATELLGYKCVWPKTNVLRIAELTLKYNGLHKIALGNCLPTKHVTTLSRDFAMLLFDIGTGAPVHLGQIFFDLIISHRCGQNMNQNLPFPSLIFGLLESQKPFQEPTEFLSTLVQPYMFRFKEKATMIEGEQDSTVATEKPSVATEDQPGAGSSSYDVVQSFFKAKLREIKKMQV